MSLNSHTILLFKNRISRFEQKLAKIAKTDMTPEYPHVRNELLKDHRERDAMQWILGRGLIHVRSVECVTVMNGGRLAKWPSHTQVPVCQ